MDGWCRRSPSYSTGTIMARESTRWQRKEVNLRRGKWGEAAKEEEEDDEYQ